MNNLTIAALKELAKERSIQGYSKMTKSRLLELLSSQPRDECKDGVCKLVLPKQDQYEENDIKKLLEAYSSVAIPESIINKIDKKIILHIANETKVPNVSPTHSVERLFIDIVIDDISQLLKECTTNA